LRCKLKKSNLHPHIIGDIIRETLKGENMTKVFQVDDALDEVQKPRARQVIDGINASIALGIPLIFYWECDGAHDMLSWIRPDHAPRATRNFDHYDVIAGYVFCEFIGAGKLDPYTINPRGHLEMLLRDNVPFVLVCYDVEYKTPAEIRALLDSWDAQSPDREYVD
jgi:hypothetical protein